MTRLFRIVALMFYVLGFIGGIVSCRAELYSIDVFASMLGALLTWLMAALFGTLFLTLSRVLDRLEGQEGMLVENRIAIEELKLEIKELRGSIGGDAVPLVVARPVEHRKLWQCTKCQAINTSTELSCGQCGAYR